MKYFSLIFLFLFIFVANVQFATAKSKNELNPNSESAQLVKEMTKQGQLIRDNDKPMEKADISADTGRATAMKLEFHEQMNKDTGKLMNIFGFDIPNYDNKIPNWMK